MTGVNPILLLHDQEQIAALQLEIDRKVAALEQIADKILAAKGDLRLAETPGRPGDYLQAAEDRHEIVNLNAWISRLEANMAKLATEIFELKTQITKYEAIKGRPVKSSVKVYRTVRIPSNNTLPVAVQAKLFDNLVNTK